MSIMADETKDIFDVLSHLNVNDHVEQKATGKTTLTYLSWPWAWGEIRKRYPGITYEIVKNEQGLPYFNDPALGIIVYTRVTVGDETREMWLPVMDGANNAMKLEAYEIQTRFGPKPVAAATMFDINKTLMRCLVKNLAMFGLGLYIYAGEDLPEVTDEAREEAERAEKANADRLRTVIGDIDEEVKKLTKSMDADAKKAFASNVIVPIIGQINYKTCKDVNKLGSLLDKVKAMVVAA